MDWEYSGLVDPAFEVAELFATLSFIATPSARREAFIDAYAEACDGADPQIATRIRTYSRLMLPWWAVRFARYLQEIPAGQDRRLAARADAWERSTRENYERYLHLAQAAVLRA